MTDARKMMMLILGLLILLSFAACTREVTYLESTAAEPASCMACHGDDNTEGLLQAEAQWANSRHASGANTDRNAGSCAGCHTSEGWMDRMLGDGVADESYNNPTAIHCFTCHAPHTTETLNLRVNDPQTIMDGTTYNLGVANICVSCHQSRRDVNTYVNDSVTLSNHWGPHHGPQGDMIYGSNGYEFAGYSYGDNLAHRSADNDACVGCHLRGTQNYVVGGHSFNMRGTVDEDEILNTAGCTGCHGELDDFDYNNVQTDLGDLAHDLGLLLEAAGYIADGHPVSGATPSEMEAGALWNYLVFEEDRSLGVHNPAYMRDLLESSIAAMTPAP